VVVQEVLGFGWRGFDGWWRFYPCWLFVIMFGCLWLGG
jgi:hypothetical protein